MYTHPVIREKQVKTTMTYPFISAKMTKIKKTDNISVSKDAKQLNSHILLMRYKMGQPH